jgi:hypothetical protein
MKLKLVKPYQMLAVGDMMDVPTPVAELLIQRKIAEPEKCTGKSQRRRRQSRSA